MIVVMKGRKYQVNKIDPKDHAVLGTVGESLKDQDDLDAAMVAAAIGLRRPLKPNPEQGDFETLQSAKDPAKWVAYAIKWMDQNATEEEITAAYAAAVGE